MTTALRRGPFLGMAPMDEYLTGLSDVPVLIDTWCTMMVAANFSGQTIKNWVGIVNRAATATGLPAVALSASAVAHWLAGHTNGNTRRTYWIALNGWSQHLVAARVRPDNPMDALRRPSLPRGCPRPVSTIGLYRILGHEKLRERTRGMVLLAAYAGLRVHEVAKVRGEDFDTDQMLIAVRGKGDRSDLLPLHPVLLPIIECMPDRGFWYPTPMAPVGRPIDPRTVTSLIKGAMKSAGVIGVPHGLRAWYATSLLRAGVDVRTVQTLMRHASLNTTQLYLEVVDEARRAAVLTLPVGSQDDWSSSSPSARCRNSERP